MNDGGPIHPCDELCHGVPVGKTSAMSLRDWFAGMALQGILANPSDIQADKIHDYLAEISYNYADAMLKKREMLNTTSPGDDPV